MLVSPQEKSVGYYTDSNNKYPDCTHSQNPEIKVMLRHFFNNLYNLVQVSLN